MLTYEGLKECGGIALFSDYLSLQRMWEIVHDVNNRSPIIRDKEGLFIGLAYDIRKAYEGQREKMEPSTLEPEIGPRFGVKFLWPTLLIQCRQLRDSLAFIDHGKEHQAVTYELEFSIQQAVRREFKADAAEIECEWGRLSADHPFLEENAYTRVAQFAAWSGAERRQGLAGLLASLQPMYPQFYPIWIRSGVKHLVAPQDFQIWREQEFPDPQL